jgi:hypothetical protein
MQHVMITFYSEKAERKNIELESIHFDLEAIPRKGELVQITLSMLKKVNPSFALVYKDPKDDSPIDFVVIDISHAFWEEDDDWQHGVIATIQEVSEVQDKRR